MRVSKGMMRAATVAVLAVLLLAGLMVRVDNLQSWSESPELFLYGDDRGPRPRPGCSSSSPSPPR